MVSESTVAAGESVEAVVRKRTTTKYFVSYYEGNLILNNLPGSLISFKFLTRY